MGPIVFMTTIERRVAAMEILSGRMVRLAIVSLIANSVVKVLVSFL